MMLLENKSEDNPIDAIFLMKLSNIDLNSEYTNLEYLNLSNIDISLLSDSVFTNVPNLKGINLSSNNLTELPVSLCKLKELRELNISNNKLSHIPEQYMEFKKLRRLNASHNMLIDIPTCILNGMNVLSNLDLSYNLLQMFKELPKCISYLNDLNLSYNENMITPTWLWSYKCSSLQILNLANTNFNLNILQNLPNSSVLIGIFQTLSVLNLSNCNLNSETVTFLSRFSNIRTLILSNEDCVKRNLFNKLPQTTWTIEELKMSSVALASLPEEINQFSFISTLDLSQNNLSWLPNSFSSLKALKICILSKNKLSHLPEDIGNLFVLEELYLDANKLHDVPHSIQMINALKYLDLYDNEFEKLPECVKRMQLCGLDISYNYLNVTNPGDDQLLPRYSFLQDELRQKRGCLDRYNFNRPQYCDPEGCDSPSSVCDASISDEEENNTRESSPKYVTPQEIWIDESDDSSDAFDPQAVYYKYCKMPRKALGSIDMSLAKMDGHLFCPFQSYQNRAIKRSIRQYPQIDGQFHNVED